jgi:predicted RecA/RadA family phage recombinase
MEGTQMAANYKAKGSTIEWTNGGSAVLSGAVVIVGSLVGIAAVDIANGATGTVHIEGVFEVPCNSADVISVGQTLTWDASADEFVDTNTPATGDNAGGVVATTAADNGVTVVEVKLLPGNGSTT